MIKSDVLDISSSDYYYMVLTSKGNIYSDGTYYNTDRAVKDLDAKMSSPSDDKFINIAAGRDYSLALTKTGRIFIWGNFFEGFEGFEDDEDDEDDDREFIEYPY